MNILAVETTGPFASIAVINEKQEISDIGSDRKLSHLQNLIPMIGDLLKECELQLHDITHIAVSEGPGSFTGIRIGMSTVKALAQALDIPVIPVPTLRSFPWNVPEFEGIICPILDARREQVYAGAYSFRSGICSQLIDDGAYYIKDFLSLLDSMDPGSNLRTMFLGDAIPVYMNEIENWRTSTNRISQNNYVIVADEDKRHQKASSTAKLALIMLNNGEERSFKDVHPVYLRKAEAERKLEERLALLEAQKDKSGYNK